MIMCKVSELTLGQKVIIFAGAETGPAPACLFDCGKVTLVL
jgi:hypothetical protein